VLVCAGTRENVATEDVLAAGALAEMLIQRGIYKSTNSVKTALDAWRKAKTSPADAVAAAENARRLLAIPALSDDVAFCLQIDKYPLVARMESGAIIRLPGGFSI
jgi:phosphosulfolactate phosphohydrolase-like enzyme